jgi:hypothetical protein
MRILQAIDVFGVAYNFNLNNTQTYKSPFGGVMSLICLVILAIFMYFFGIDFYYKKNPKVIGSTVFNKDYYTISLNSSQGILAWKIEDHYTNMPNFTGILFPRIIYQKFAEDPETKFLNFVDSQVLPQKRCDQVKDVDDILKANYDLKTWWCLDFTGTNFTFGGYWGGKIVNMIYMMIDACNEDKSSCSSLKDVQSLAPGSENSLFFSMLYPQAYFSPNDLQSPLNYEYYYFTETIDLHVIKKNVFFFTKYMLEDDLGWMATDINYKSIFVYQSFFKDYFYKDSAQWTNVKKDQNTVVYMNGLYFDKNAFLYTRSFMKLQELTAQVGGAIKSTIVIFAILSRYVNSMGIITHFGNIFFTRKKFEKTKEKTSLNPLDELILKNNLLSQKRLDPSNNKDIKEKTKILSEKTDSNDDLKNKCKTQEACETKDYHKIPTNLKEINNGLKHKSEFEFLSSAKIYEKTIKVDSSIEFNSKHPLNSNKINYFDMSSPHCAKLLLHQQINKYKDNALFSLGKSACRCNSSKSRKELQLISNFLLHKVSLESYLYNTILFDNLQHLLLDKNQKILFSSLQQINLNNRNRLKELQNDAITDEVILQGILNSYNTKLQKGELTLNDMKIISLLQTD